MKIDENWFWCTPFCNDAIFILSISLWQVFYCCSCRYGHVDRNVVYQKLIFCILKVVEILLAWKKFTTYSKIWHILYKLWLLQNHSLRQNTINDNHGADSLDYSITVEYHIGALGLPSHFNAYFSKPLPTILAKDIKSKKKWFKLIRRAREIHNITIRDAFQTNVILWNWVHLPNTM